jgi:hypothetical protein
MTVRTSALRDAWSGATDAESAATAALVAALADRGSYRVVKARIAYMAGALGSKTTAPNCAGAVRVLDVAKTTLHPYWKTGELLAAAGFAERITPPTSEEIALAASVFDEVNERNAATKGNASKSPAETDGDAPKGVGEPTPVVRADATQADVIAAIAELQATLASYTREQGFARVVTDNMVDALTEIIATMETFTVDGGDA